MTRMFLALAAVATAAVAPPPVTMPTETAAALLARIDSAVGEHGGRRRIAQAVRALDRLGVHPADPADDPRPGWRTAGGERAARFRGRVLGPAFRRGWIDPGATTTTEQQFLAGQKTTLAVAAAPSAPLTLAVTDPANSAMCHGSGQSCSWYPLFTQRYTISIRNAGTQRVRFYLVVD